MERSVDGGWRGGWDESNGRMWEEGCGGWSVKKDTGIKSLMNMKSLWPQVVCGGADTYHTTYQHRKSSSEAPLLCVCVCVCTPLFNLNTG